MRIEQVSNVVQTQASQQLTNHALGDLFKQMEKHGVEFVADPAKNYYMRVPTQMSAGDSLSMVKVDADLAEAIMSSLKTGGRISRAEVLDPIMTRLTDGGRYGSGEAVLARLLLSACDDRKTVLIGGDRINITDAAEKTLNSKLHSFWGKLGAKARWGSSDPGIEPKAPPVNQSGGFDKLGF